ncbi:MAG: hypothetical protein RIR01_1458 [Bacteroidota bacterium]|jgi:hypothetical protein
MKAILKFLINFYHPSGKQYLVGDEIEIDVDSENTPLDGFWYEQIKHNNGHFSLTKKENKTKKQN